MKVCAVIRCGIDDDQRPSPKPLVAAVEAQGASASNDDQRVMQQCVARHATFRLH